MNDGCTTKGQGPKTTDGSDKISKPTFEEDKKNAVNSSTNSKDSDGNVNTTNNIDETVKNRANVGPDSVVVVPSGAHSTSKTSKDSVGDETSQVSAQGKNRDEETGKEQGLEISNISDKKFESASEVAENNGVN